ncbi:MAG: M56 family metallopeptidase [Acidobacteriota bacterium]|nr:M56 family metallopeptidase [Acidobacteriota bacterium]
MNYFWNVLTARDGFEFLALLASAAAKSTLLFAFVAFLCLSFRRFSAVARHSLWVSVVCASLLLPCLFFLSIWELPVLPATKLILAESGANELTGNNLLIETPKTRIDESASVQNDLVNQTNTEFLPETSLAAEISNLPKSSFGDAEFFSPQTVNGILAVWFAVALLLLFRLFLGFSATDLLARRAAEFKNAELNELFASLLTELDLKGKVRLLRSEHTRMPIVCGVWRPSVLLPANAEEWSAERLRIVLLHELTHVARRDCLTQILAHVACAFYWFNPLAWYAARRLRCEREQACDERVLSVGTKPSDYAHHLLEIARSIQESSIFEWSKTTTVAMARKSQFEGRLLAIINTKSEQCRMSRLMIGSVVAVICVLFISLAVIRPTRINAQKQELSKTTFTDERDKADETFLPDSFPAMNEDSSTVRDSEISEREAAGKQKNADISSDKPEERDLTDERISEIVEQSIKLASEENVQQNISETIQQKTASPVQTSEAIPPPAPEVNPFVNAEYRQKSESQTQNKSGDFIDEMASVGLTNLSVDELVMMKTHRVTADFIGGLRALGFNNLTPKTITNLRIYNVTPAYIEAMTAAGYKGLTLKDLTNARIYKVTPEYAKAIQDAGYPSLSIGQIINFRIYNVTPELVRSARSRLGDLTPKQMVSLKISGVLNKVEDRKKDKK